MEPSPTPDASLEPDPSPRPRRVNRQLPREPRRSAFSRGYTKRWTTASKAFRLLYPLCGMRPPTADGTFVPPVMSGCFVEQRTTPATLTDHVIPHRGDEVLFWAETNWQSLCDHCHNRKTQHEDADVKP